MINIDNLYIGQAVEYGGLKQIESINLEALTVKLKGYKNGKDVHIHNLGTLVKKQMAGKKGTTGGAREGSGRKPLEDKKQPVTIYVPTTRIEKLTVEKIKAVSLAAIEKEFRKSV